MRAFPYALIALAALTASLWFSERAGADDAWTRYNQMQARRQFLVSTSPTRTYSGLEPGPAYTFYYPYGYGVYWGLPGYRHERIGPRGYERFDYPASPSTVAWGTRNRVLMRTAADRVLELRTRLEPDDRIVSPSMDEAGPTLKTTEDDRVLSTRRLTEDDRVLSTRPLELDRTVEIRPPTRAAGEGRRSTTGGVVPRVLPYREIPTAPFVLPPPSPPPADRLPPPPAYAR